MPKPTEITLDANKFRVKEYRRGYQSLVVPRQDNAGIPGAENLHRSLWPWTLSEFSRGEGRQVFNRAEANQGAGPSFWKSDGAIDTRTPGEFSMAPVDSLVIAAAGNTTTRNEGSSFSNVAGTTVTGSNREFDAVNDEAEWASRTPGAVAVSVAYRQIIKAPGTASITIRLNVRNDTDATDTVTDSTAYTGVNGVATKTLSFTGVAGKSYSYEMKTTAVSGGATAQLDLADETTGASPLTDARAFHHGYADNMYAHYWDGTNSHVLLWDFVNDDWDTVTGTIAASQVVAMTSSDKNEYILLANGIIYNFTTGAETVYTGAATGTPVGMAAANNRLYLLTMGATRFLYEIDLDSTALPITENTVNYKRVANNSDFADEENPGAMPGSTTAQECRQKVTAVANGIRYFSNSRGGPTHIYEFSENTNKPIAVMQGGLHASAIHHYDGVTYIAATARSRASAPAKQRSGIWYIAADRVLRHLAWLRFDDPDDEPVRFIDADGSNVYFLQGNKVWRYDTSNGAITLDRTISGSDDTKARGLAVMDNKMWVAHQSQGVFVTQDTYPVDNTVYLYSGKWDYDVPEFDKTLLSAQLVTKPLAANTTIRFEYDLDESGTWTTTDKDGATMSSSSGSKHSFTIANTGANTKKGRVVEWRVGLSSSDGVSTPTVRSVSARSTVNKYEEFIDVTLDLTDDSSVNRPMGRQDTGNRKWTFLKTSIENENLVSLTPHFEDAKQFPGEATAETVMIQDPFGELVRQGQGEAKLRLIVVA